MRYLIVSDMHANWEAFRAVLRKVKRKRFDATLVLGDLVGYGAAPNQVVEAVRAFKGKVYMVRGNHDKVVAGIDDGSSFNRVALAAALWTRKVLSYENISFVRSLPKGPVKVNDELLICHGAPQDEDYYILSERDALFAFSASEERVVFIGHTHIASVFVYYDGYVEGSMLLGDKGVIKLHPQARYLINPGSVGQPRDRNPKAAFMIYDEQKSVVRWYRINYPIAAAQKRIINAGLPKVLADRLAVGF